MRLVTMLGLAAVAAVAAMAFVGATSALATDTQLCLDHDGLACEEGATTWVMESENTSVFLHSYYFDMRCDDISVSATPLALASPQEVHFSSLAIPSCHSYFAGDYLCRFRTAELPSASLLKVGLDAGVLTLTSGGVVLECEDPFFEIVFLDCEYDLTGVQFSVGAQHLTANETTLNEVNLDYLCPEEFYLDALLKMTANSYVLA